MSEYNEYETCNYCLFVEDENRGVEFCVNCGVESGRQLFKGLGECAHHSVFRPRVDIKQKQIDTQQKQIVRLQKQIDRLQKQIDRHNQKQLKEFERNRQKQLRQESQRWHKEIREEETRQRRYTNNK